MGNWESQVLPPSLSERLDVRAEVVNGDDEVLLDLLGGATERVTLTSLQARQLGEALYLASAAAGWARFRRETEGE